MLKYNYNNNNIIHFSHRSDSKFSAVQPTNFQKLVVLIKKLIVSLENQEKQFLSKAIELTVGDHVLTNQSTKVTYINHLIKKKITAECNLMLLLF